jgi:HNH endonuclease
MSTFNSTLTREMALSLFDYDPSSGTFTRKTTRGRCNRWKAGQSVGHLASSGYVQIGIGRKLYQAHRLVWLCEYGRFPEKHLDHINGDRSDNRVANLRECDDLLNMQNIRKAHKDNSLGVLGVKKYRDRFIARIFHNGKEKTLGIHVTAELAHAAYLKAKRELHAGCTI